MSFFLAKLKLEVPISYPRPFSRAGAVTDGAVREELIHVKHFFSFASVATE